MRFFLNLTVAVLILLAVAACDSKPKSTWTDLERLTTEKQFMEMIASSPYPPDVREKFSSCVIGKFSERYTYVEFTTVKDAPTSAQLGAAYGTDCARQLKMLKE